MKRPSVLSLVSQVTPASGAAAGPGPLTGAAPERKLIPGRQYFIPDGAFPDYPATIIKTRPSRVWGLEAYVSYAGQDKRHDHWVRAALIGDALPSSEDIAEASGGVESYAEGSKRRKLNKVPATPSRSRAVNAQQDSSGEVTAPSTPERQHAALTRVRNIEDVRWGSYRIKTWYYSPYPTRQSEAVTENEPAPARTSLGGATSRTSPTPGKRPSTTAPPGPGGVQAIPSPLAGLSWEQALAEHGYPGRLWVCDRCFKYMYWRKTWQEHFLACSVRQPPGRCVYEHENHRIYEVDGDLQKAYCQRLSLFGKLFIDHKSICFDVERFFFYVYCEASTSVHDQPLGFFSKEKKSLDEYNVACITVFPPFMGGKYGRALIEFSYILTYNSASPGTPERPISDLGMQGYKAYWATVILRFFRRVVHELKAAQKSSRQPGHEDADAAGNESQVVERDMTLERIAKAVRLTREDVDVTLRELLILEPPSQPNPGGGAHATATSDADPRGVAINGQPGLDSTRPVADQMAPTSTERLESTANGSTGPAPDVAPSKSDDGPPTFVVPFEWIEHLCTKYKVREGGILSPEYVRLG